jgi:hypothetical protein
MWAVAPKEKECNYIPLFFVIIWMDTPEDDLVVETCMMNLLIKLHVVLDGCFLNRIKIKNRDKGKHLNNTYIDTYNLIFDVMQELNNRQ